MVVDTILYDRLSVNPNATDKEIKKAYRKLSMKWHPDKNNSDEATEKFQEISEAYSILSDSDKRSQYDSIGIDILKNSAGMNVDPNDIFKHFMGGFGGFPGSFPGGGPNPFTSGPFAAGGQFSGGPFGGFASGGFPGAGGPFGTTVNREENDDCVVKVNVTLEQLYNQEDINIKYNQKNYCNKCNGNGTKDSSVSKCDKCNGSGRVTITKQMGNMIQQMIRSCGDCSGTGEKISQDNKCNDCDGKKFKIKEKNIDIKLNNNLNDNHQVKVNNKGHNLKNGRSDLIILIQILPHDIFIKERNDLHMNMDLKFYQYLFGLNKVINHLDNRNILINVKEFNIDNINDDIIIKVDNEGMNKNGDLIIHFKLSNLDISSLENNEKDILKKILMKCDLDEFKNEMKILKNKDNLIHTNSTQIKDENNSDNEEHHESGPECVQQ